MQIGRPTTDEIARLISTLIGVTIVIVAVWRSLPYGVSATGIGVMFFGTAHFSVSSSGAVPAKKRRIYTVIGLVVAASNIVLACYVVWELTSSIASTAVVLTAAASLYSLVYFASRPWITKLHGHGKGIRGANFTDRCT